MADLQPGDIIPILGQMGVTIEEAVPGRSVAVIPSAPNVNHFGVMYAGSLFSVAECLGGVIALASFDLSAGVLPVAKSLSIDFLAPASSDIRAEATLSEAEVARVQSEIDLQRRSSFDLTTSLSDDTGKIVARTMGTYVLRSM